MRALGCCMVKINKHKCKDFHLTNRNPSHNSVGHELSGSWLIFQSEGKHLFVCVYCCAENWRTGRKSSAFLLWWVLMKTRSHICIGNLQIRSTFALFNKCVTYFGVLTANKVASQNNLFGEGTWSNLGEVMLSSRSVQIPMALFCLSTLVE